MVRFTRGIGNRIELTVKESFDILKEIYVINLRDFKMRESGFQIKLKGMEFTNISMGQNMKDIGKMINRMGMESRFGMMEVNTKVYIKMEANMGLKLFSIKVKENIVG